LEFYKLVVKSIQYFLFKKKCQSVLNFLENFAQIDLGFLAICKKKEIFLYYSFRFVWYKPIFWIKTNQNRSKGCLPNTTLNQKKINKNKKAKQIVYKPFDLDFFDLT